MALFKYFPFNFLHMQENLYSQNIIRVKGVAGENLRGGGWSSQILRTSGFAGSYGPPGQKKVPYSCNHLAFILFFFVTVLFWSVIPTISCKKIAEICACEVSTITAHLHIDTLLFPKMLNLQLKIQLMITADWWKITAEYSSVIQKFLKNRFLIK